jgi:S-adenosylmethionine-diacylglycerol 3-amino-3-carboxypropyl transferase
VGPLVEQLFAARDLTEQSSIFEQQLWPRVWRRGIRSMVSRDTTLAMLGVPRPQRLQVERYCQGGIAGFIESCMRSVFAERPLSDNYFYHAYLLGGYSPHCCPDYIRPENLDRLRDGLIDRIHIHTTTMENFLRESPRAISRFVLLDHMDWLANVDPRGLSAEWQAIIDRAAPQTRILWRSGGPNADFLVDLQVRRGEQTQRISELLDLDEETASRLHQRDRVATYASFYIAHLAA